LNFSAASHSDWRSRKRTTTASGWRQTSRCQFHQILYASNLRP